MTRSRLTIMAMVLLSASLLAMARTAKAQAAQPTGAPQPAAQTSPAQQQPAAEKKVWTNDDVADLRDHSVISVGGNARAANASQKQTPRQNARETNWYRGEILKLQAKIPPLDEKIQQLQAGLDGKTVNSVRTYGATRADDWRDQLTRLRKQRDDLTAKIASLEDEARHKGIPPNSLP